MIKTGAQHIETLKDGRHVYINGRLAGDVTIHSSFRRTIESVGMLYDFQARPENRALMTFETPDGGEPANRIWQLPQSSWRSRRASASPGGLDGTPLRFPRPGARSRRLVHRRHVHGHRDLPRPTTASAPARWPTTIDTRETTSFTSPMRSSILRRIARRARANSRIRFLTAGVVDQDARGDHSPRRQDAGDGRHHGERGARHLHSAAGQGRGTLRGLLRRPDERQGPENPFPQILRGRRAQRLRQPARQPFDENDAVLYFDDVKVPWERVFVNQDLAMCQTQFHATPAHVYQNYQSQIRLMVKMRFLVGIARRIAETNGVINFPQVQRDLGFPRGAKHDGRCPRPRHGSEGPHARCVLHPRRHTLYSAQVYAAALSPGHDCASRVGGRRTDHAALLVGGFRRRRTARSHRQDAAVSGFVVARTA